MKTRENELHEPKITFELAHGGYNSYGSKKCSVCGYSLAYTFGCTEQGAKELYIDNYCPNCGARLKEVE